MPLTSRNILGFAIIPVALLSFINDSPAECDTPLSPPSIFQEEAGNSSSTKKYSILSDLRLFTVVFEIGEYFFVDKLPQRRLKDVIEFRFSNNPDFLQGIRIGGVRRVENIVYIPYQRDGRRYIVKMSDKGIAPGWQASDRLRSERFRILISELPVSSPKTLP